jgi:hypothetical protein
MMMRKWLLPVLTLALVFALGYLFSLRLSARWGGRKVEDNAQVLLERIRAVAKLTTVEGYFTEVYDYKDYWGYDISFLRKKALLRVKAKVSVGYDLNHMTVDMKPEQKLIVISNLPEPAILSIDHDIDYYDISQGVFNSFTEADYNRINRNAKAFIEARAKESDLLEAAEKQGNLMLDLIRNMAEGAGWQVVMEPRQTWRN